MLDILAKQSRFDDAHALLDKMRRASLASPWKPQAKLSSWKKGMVAMAGSAECSPVTGLRRRIRASSSAVSSHPPEGPETSPWLAITAPRRAYSDEGEAVEESDAAADVGCEGVGALGCQGRQVARCQGAVTRAHGRQGALARARPLGRGVARAWALGRNLPGRWSKPARALARRQTGRWLKTARALGRRLPGRWSKPLGRKPTRALARRLPGR